MSEKKAVHERLWEDWTMASEAESGDPENGADYRFCYWLVRHSGWELKHPDLHYGVDRPGTVRVPIDWSPKNPRRDQFAAAALDGLIARGWDGTNVSGLMAQSVLFADALIAELDRVKP